MPDDLKKHYGQLGRHVHSHETAPTGTLVIVRGEGFRDVWARMDGRWILTGEKE